MVLHYNSFLENSLKDLYMLTHMEVFTCWFLLTFKSYVKIDREWVACNTACTFIKQLSRELLRRCFSKAHSALIYQSSQKILKLHQHRPQLT